MNRKRNMSIPVVAILAFLQAVCCFTGARADDKFTVYQLSVAGQLLQHWVEDLDGDGLKDIFVVHRKGVAPEETRWVSIFRQHEELGFATAPDRSWELAREAAILDIGDVAGDDAQKEIVYSTGHNVRYYRFENGSYATDSIELFEARGLTVYPSRRDIPMVNFVRDWNGDGRDDVAVAGFDGLSIFFRGADGGYTAPTHVALEVETGVARAPGHGVDNKTIGIVVNYEFPSLLMVDANGDTRSDLVAVTEDRARVFVRHDDRTYSTEPLIDHWFDVRTQQEKLEGISDVETQVEDLNNDGFADAIVVKQTSKGLTSFRGVVNVFWGGPDGFKDVPDQVIISEGTASSRASFIDVNGDGRKDLVLPSVKFSVAAVIRILITRSIKVSFNIFLLGEDGRLAERPTFKKEVKFKIDLSGASDEQAMDLKGDYNGDGRTDFVFATDRDELSVYTGEIDAGDRLFTKKPVTKVNADAFGQLQSPDLNGDGFSDMVIYYPQSRDKQGIIQVLLNNGRW